SYDAFFTVREALAFTQKWQRTDGKMAHELSQTEKYIDWFKDYPYGYIHGDTTPYYIAAMYDYYLLSADEAFIKSSWNSLKRAYSWCLSTDENDDGLMDNQNQTDAFTLHFVPELGIGSKIVNVKVNEQSVAFEQIISTQTIQPEEEFILEGPTTVEVAFDPTVELLPPYIETKTGDSNKGLKIISVKHE
ncbi:MAG: hypothetical protein ACE5HX_19485, partial [bacterium]